MSLRNILDKMEPHFHKGGKYENWYALYEAADTIFYTPGHVTKTAAHVRDAVDLKRMMILVWMCTFPAVLFGLYNVGLQANTAMATLGITEPSTWQGGLTALFTSFNPDSLWDNIIHGAMYWLPIYLTTFIVGGFWEVLFAMKRGHEVRFFSTEYSALIRLIEDHQLVLLLEQQSF